MGGNGGFLCLAQQRRVRGKDHIQKVGYLVRRLTNHAFEGSEPDTYDGTDDLRELMELQSSLQDFRCAWILFDHHGIQPCTNHSGLPT